MVRKLINMLRIAREDPFQPRGEAIAVDPRHVQNALASGSQFSALRALSAELKSFLDAVDARVLEQSRVLADVPTNHVKPPAAPMSASRAAAYGLIQYPQFFGNEAERQSVLEHRSAMRELRNDPGRVTGSVEMEQKIQQFEKDEQIRWNAAAEMLRRGMAPGHTAAHCHLTTEEIENLQAQLDGTAPVTVRNASLATCGDS